MSSRTSGRRPKKLFTVAEANAMLPLLRAILRDITVLANQLHNCHERLTQFQEESSRSSGETYNEDVDRLQDEFDRGRQQMHEHEAEVRQLGVELKDYYTGLVDFPALMDGRIVYLCWRLGEDEVAHWHELDAGFAGRQKLTVDTANS